VLGTPLLWRSTVDWVAFTYLKVKSAKCLCLLPVVLLGLVILVLVLRIWSCLHHWRLHPQLIIWMVLILSFICLAAENAVIDLVEVGCVIQNKWMTLSWCMFMRTREGLPGSRRRGQKLQLRGELCPHSRNLH